MSYAALDEPRLALPPSFVLRDGQGREFPLSTRFRTTTWLVGADIWVRGELAFEVAPNALADLSLLFIPAFERYGPLPTQYLEVPLELDPTAVLDETDVEIYSTTLGEGER